MPSELAKSLNKLMRKGRGMQQMNSQLASFAEERFDAARQLRRIFEIRWYLTRAFLRGEQYVFWNRGAGQLDRHRSLDPRRVRMVDNKILHYTRKQQSKYLRLRPIAEVLPNSNDLDDIDAAKLGTDILKHLHRTLEGPKISRDIANWITSTGNAFVVDYWNEKVPGGEVAFEVDSPFCWYFPALSHGPVEVQGMPWAARAKLRSLSWIKDNLDFDAKPESFMADQNIMMLMRELDQAVTGLEEVYMPSAIVKEFWIKPGKEFPKGVYFIVVNRQVVKKGAFPNYGTEDEPKYEYPVTHFRDITIPGQFWGMATSEAAIPLQKDFNRIRSSIIEWVRTMAKGKWLAPKGSGLSPTAIDNEHGEVLEFSLKRGMAPTQVRIANLPPAVLQALDINRQSFMDLYSQHEVTQGTNRSDLRSGQMVALLLEQDDSAHAMSYQDFEDQWAKMWKHALLLVQHNYKNTRTLKVLGAGAEWKVKSFKGADLKNNTDVFVSTGMHLPENRIAKQSVVMERFTQGLYGDPADPGVQARVRRMLDDAIPEDVYNEVEADQEFAMNENRMMRAGFATQINNFDNHRIHIQEHERDVKSAQVQQLIRNPEMGGAVLNAFNQHMGQHAQKMQEMLQQQMAMMPQQGQGQGQPRPPQGPGRM